MRILRYTSLLLSIAVALVCDRPGMCAWSIAPVDLAGTAGWSLFLDTDAAGKARSAYYTTSPNGYLRYASQEAAGWQVGQTIEFGSAFALDRNGDRFFVSTPGPNYYPQFQMLLDNGLLLQQQLASSRISSEVFLDFDTQNRPHIGYVDTDAQQLKYTFWNGTSWTTRTVATDSGFQSGNSGFAAALDASGQVHFTWRTAADRLQYAKPNGASWQITSPFPTSNAGPLDLVIDSAGKSHLAYYVSTGNVHTGGLFYSQLSGSTWTGGRIPGLDDFGAARSQIVVDSMNQPHLFSYDATFSGPDKLKHIYRQSGNWSNETIDSFASTTSGPESIAAVYDRGFHVLYSTDSKQIFYASLFDSVLNGDYNQNGVVDAADYVVWRNSFGQSGAALAADGDGNGTVDNNDAAIWRLHIGETAGSGSGLAALGDAAVPEPATVALLFLGSVFAFCRRGR